MKYMRNIGASKYQRGPTRLVQPTWARPGGLCSPQPTSGLVGPGRPPMPIFCYMVCSDLEKIRRNLSGRSAAVSRRNLGRTNLGLWRSCSAGKLPSGRGKSKPSSSPTILSSRGGQYPSTSSPKPSPLKP